jgi:5-aminopentanamidase
MTDFAGMTSTRAALGRREVTGDVGVAVCQLAPRFGEVSDNVERAVAAVESAAAAGADVVVLPELVTTGYVFADRTELRSLAEPADGSSVTAFVAAARAQGVVLVGGFAEAVGDQVHNSAFLVDPTGLRVVYRKAHLWDRETTLFRAGSDAPPVVATQAGRIGVVICYDLEFPEWSRTAALAGADLLCVPTNWPAQEWPAGEHAPQLVHAQSTAMASRVFVAVCDRVGEERGQDWAGGSGIVSPEGYPVVESSRGGGEQSLIGRCRLASARDKRTSHHNHTFADRRPDLYGHLSTEMIRESTV